jgi:cobalt-precorrin-5B (C1)-methyltransferase
MNNRHGAAELQRAEFDLQVLAPNGLRRGRTTGSCATAAVTAALSLLLRGRRRHYVEVALPDGKHYLVVPIEQVELCDTARETADASTIARAAVRKDGGDDPDNTHGAIIFAEVRLNRMGEVRFFAGAGVGTATKPGLRVAVGQAAINPVPRAMMRQAVADLLAECNIDPQQGFDLHIGCENGEIIARKTFNPRLGILGGISILGTSGIVEPMSMASWVASVEVYVRVALASDDVPQAPGAPVEAVAYLPGKIGRDYAADVLGLPEQRTVQIANFLGDALDFTQTALSEAGRRLPVLWLAGHPGKLAKVLDFSDSPQQPDGLAAWAEWAAWDTHSSRSEMAMGGVARVAAERGYSQQMVQAIQQANTVEAAMEMLKDAPGAQALWIDIEQRIAQRVAARVPAVDKVKVRLFDLAGNLLGERP